MSGYSEIRDDKAFELALACAKGTYQEDILTGREALSGATLRGAAKHWGGKYKQSRQNLLARLTKAGVPWSERRGPHGMRILVIGE